MTCRESASNFPNRSKYVLLSINKSFFFLLVALLFCCKGVIGDGTVKISDVSEFIEFVNNVNSGTTYSGTTVLLDSDLSLSGETLEPIGNTSSNYFLGVFDGQGHIISNLKMSSSSKYAGLFGYSKGLTIKNAVLDSSCSITSSFSGSDDVYVGRIIGYCSGQCNIENNVNMADVTFSGTISGNSLYLGGIAGKLEYSKYYSYVKNCANYGSITHSGTSKYLYIGGIVGRLSGSNYIQNCLNYRAIIHSGTTSYLALGGITGYSYYAHVDNCVSAGGISTQNTPSYNYIGSIAGEINSHTYINYCYYTSELNDYKMYGKGTPETSSYTLSYDNTTFELSDTVSVGNYTRTSLINALNTAADYYLLREYSKWLFNKEKKTVNFTINSRTSPIAMSSQIILLPNLASEGNITFSGWYNDGECTNPLESFEVDDDTTLYGKFEENTNNYTISFDTRGGSYVASITTQFGTVVSLPTESIREHCSLASWETGYGDKLGLNLTMPSRNFTLYAVWKCTYITTSEDLTDFSKVVNTGTNYLGTTVLLDSDLSLSGETPEPIGKDNSNYFRGTFDGQGHIISGLKTNSSSQYSGLFGFSKGLTIRNVVLDSSCSITSSFSGSNNAHAGGIVGYCYAEIGECAIENNVNMADVTFNGKVNGNYKYLYLGGIAGSPYSSWNPIYMKNCANYGSITYSGTSSNSYIGGIAGELSGSYYKYKYLYNCLNHGTITHNGTTSSDLRIGGIAGYSKYTYIENCVSAGEISMQNTLSYSYIGSIVGYVSYNTYINYCYYTSELSGYDLYGYAYSTPSTAYALSYDNTTFELSGIVSVGSYTGTSLINALNTAADYYLLRDYSKWLLNKEKKTANFTINSRTSPIAMSSQIILLPSLASEGNITFSGWYNDSEYTNPLESFEVDDDTTLYGRFEENINNYTISFDTRGGSYVASITTQFGTTVSLPSDVTREHCDVAFWETEYGDYVGFSLAMPAHNFTLRAVWKCTHIKTLDDFVDFSKVVSTGTNGYLGTTVYLDSDLSLSGKTLEPIGKDYSNYFLGVFDGQGHIISDFKINTFSSEYTGLFDYSKGLTIRNIVLDSSCSITSSFSGSDDAYVGGIIGYCYASSGQCSIENSVNMADVTFNGYISGDTLYLGGIAGRLEFSYDDYYAYVKNCANYGSVTHSEASECSDIGGIVGYLWGSKYNYLYVYNCLNYGTITHSGTKSSYLYVGGIAGYGNYAHIENCVSAGKISTQNTPSSSYIGSIVGYVYSYTYINYCYYTSNIGGYPINGTGTPSSITGTPTSPTDVNITLVNKLNSNATSCNWNKWLLNVNKASVMFKVNGNAGFIIDSKIVLLPDLVDNGERSFSGWYTDAILTSLFTDNEVNTETTLHGVFCGPSNYTVTFDVNGGDASSLPLSHSMAITCNNTYRGLINPAREGYSFIGWFTECEGGDRIEPGDDITNFNNHTLYAQWSANNYTVALNVSDEVNLNVTSITVTFNSTYKELPTPTKAGYVFIGWFTKETNGAEVTNETIVTTPNNHTFYAQWSANNYTVTLDLGNGTVITRTLHYNEPIELPRDIAKEGCTHTGWDNSIITTMPAKNITINALWDCTRNSHSSSSSPDEPISRGDKSKSSSNTGAIAGGVVGGVVAIILILVVVLLLFFKKKEGATRRRRRDGIEMRGMNLRIVEKSLNAPEAGCCDDNSSKTLSDSLSKLYSGPYKVPTVAEALYMAGLSENRINTAVESCTNAGTSAAKEGVLLDGFGKEDAAAVALYTFDFGGGDYESNPYRIINRALATRSNDNDLRKASGLLYLVLSALRKLPKYTGGKLYRGIREGVDVTSYKEGSTVVWHGLSSTSPDMSATKAFLAKDAANKKAEGTLFVIDNGWGYDIQPYSLFPEEAEILLEPERRFKVQSVIEAELTVINLEMIDTPVILPEVFGESVC